jgi:hypothetical protein
LEGFDGWVASSALSFIRTICLSGCRSFSFDNSDCVVTGVLVFYSVRATRTTTYMDPTHSSVRRHEGKHRRRIMTTVSHTSLLFVRH